MGISRGKKIVTDGLVFYIDAANPKSYVSGSVLCNNMFDELQGTLTNGVSVDSSITPSFQFDGVNDYIDMDDFSFSGTEVTINVWNFGEVTDKQQTLFEVVGANHGSKRCIVLIIPWSDSKVYFDAGDATVGHTSGYDRISKTATDAECNGWHHWVFTKNTSTGNQRIYHDSVLWHSGSSNTVALLSNDRTSLGKFSAGGVGYYQQGKASQLMIYNKELTASEVLQNYNALKDRFI